MELKELVKGYYKSGFNCAESIIRGANEYFGLNLNSDMLKAASGFGKGMFALSTCGVITGSIMIMSYKYGREDSSEKSKVNIMAKEFTDEFRNRTSGSFECKELLKLRDPKEGCIFVLENGCDTLESIMMKYESLYA
jgi:C_GCAxxG_C_C family probable redox protein